MKVKYFSTSRFINGGFSYGNYNNFNLATHTQDNLQSVENNRKLLIKKYDLPSTPKYLTQTHSNICLDANSIDNFGDSIVTTKKDVVCLVMTADCLPIFAWSENNKMVGVAHAGWQGILNGVIENFIAKFPEPKNVNIVFGVALGQESFEVKSDFYQKFISKNQNFNTCFVKYNDRYRFDIYKAATVALNALGVAKIQQNCGNTFTDSNLFSYRRDGKNSGRQAHFIWF